MATSSTAQKPSGSYSFATGRRKSAVANVRLFEGKGDFTVNKKSIDSYFQDEVVRQGILRPFALTGNEELFHFTATVRGGGIKAQGDAIMLGLAKAFTIASEDHKKVMKTNGLLTRDDRVKERKKPGLRRARRSPQWAKR